MSWFFIALIAPFLWSIVNHIDKYLLSKHSANSSVGALMIFSTFAGAIVLVVTSFFINPFLSSSSEIILLITAGILASLAITCFLFALQKDEASIVVPFVQLIPIFGYIFGYIFLGEVISSKQIVASIIIILGATILSLEFIEERRIRLRSRVILFMLGNAFFYALSETIFKISTVQENFWASVFWQHTGLLLFGLILYTFFSKARKDFHRVVGSKNHRVQILGINISSEIITLLGNIATNFAILLAPVSLVLLVSGYQPVFAFIIGVLITIFLPHLGEEKITLKHLVHKSLSIAIILIGSYMLFS